MTNTERWIRILALAVALVPATALAQQGYPPPPPQYPPPQYGAPPRGATTFKPGFELVGMAGYHVASDVSFASGHASIDGAASYGAMLRYKPRPMQSVDLLWVYVPTNMTVVSTLLPGIQSTSLSINYFQVGGSTSFRSDRVEPYFGATIGAAVFSPGTIRTSSVTLNGSDLWRFGFTVGGGLKIWIVEQLALQIDARMLAPIWFSSASFYAGGGGAAFGVSGGIPTIEGNFTGGIVIAP